LSKFILNLPSQIIFLKSGYNIPLRDKENKSLQLLIELGDFGVSLIWIDKLKMQIAALAVYIFEESDDAAARVKEILNDVHTKDLKIFYNYKDSMLVPEKYYNESLNAQMLSLLFGENDDAVVRTDMITKLSMYNIYRLPSAINNYVNERFPAAAVSHSTSHQICGDREGTEMICIVFYDAIKVMVYIDGHLYFVQQFKYSSPEDVTYHLLNTCQQHDIKPSEIKLHICGMIVEDSSLYQHLYQYFLHIDFVAMTSPIKMKDDVNDLPAHFFSHLTELATCES